MTFNELFTSINSNLSLSYGSFYDILFKDYLTLNTATIRYNLSVDDLESIVKFYFNTYLFEIKLYNAIYADIENFINTENFKDRNEITRLNEVLVGKINTKFNELKTIATDNNNTSTSLNELFNGMTSNNLNAFSSFDKTNFNDTSINTNTQNITGNADDNFNEVSTTGNKIQEDETALNGSIGKIYFDWLNTSFQNPRRNIIKNLDDLKIKITGI